MKTDKIGHCQASFGVRSVAYESMLLHLTREICSGTASLLSSFICYSPLVFWHFAQVLGIGVSAGVDVPAVVVRPAQIVEFLGGAWHHMSVQVEDIGLSGESETGAVGVSEVVGTWIGSAMAVGVAGDGDGAGVALGVVVVAVEDGHGRLGELSSLVVGQPVGRAGDADVGEVMRVSEIGAGGLVCGGAHDGHFLRRADEDGAVEVAVGRWGAAPVWESVLNYAQVFIPHIVVVICGVGRLVGRPGWREPVVLVVGIEDLREADLLEVVDAFDGARLFSRLCQGGQEHGGQNGDDGDHDQEFDEREWAMFHLGCPVVGGWLKRKLCHHEW